MLLRKVQKQTLLTGRTTLWAESLGTSLSLKET